MSKIDEIKNEQENDKRTDDTINRTNNAIKGTALVAAGIPTAYVSKDYLLGKKNAYHVTTLDNWNDDIRRSGLKYVKGGGGLAAKNDFSADRRNRYIYNSLNNVHATSNKNFAKRLADYYERQGEDSKLLKLKINYNKYKNNMRVDPDSLVPNGGNFFYNNDTKFGRHNLKNFGAKGKVDISPEEIVGSDAKLGSRIKNTALNLPGYIKENPLRFAAGTALAAGGTYATYKGIQKLKKSRNKNREEERNMSKAALEYVDIIEKIAEDNTGSKERARFERINRIKNYAKRGAGIGAGIGSAAGTLAANKKYSDRKNYVNNLADVIYEEDGSPVFNEYYVDSLNSKDAKIMALLGGGSVGGLGGAAIGSAAGALAGAARNGYDILKEKKEKRE